jgi:hypothetical protein
MGGLHAREPERNGPDDQLVGGVTPKELLEPDCSELVCGLDE